MSKKSTVVKSPSSILGSTLSLPKNARETKIKHVVESEWSIQILKGTLNGHSQFVVSIQSHAETVPSYYRYADIMSVNSSKIRNIEIDLMNRGGLGRGEFTQIQSYIERLRKEHAYIEGGDISGLFSTENTQEYADVAILEREAEMYFNLLLEYIDENIELFPVRNLETDIDSKEGYQDGVSQGVYIADAKGIKKYGCESIAIIPQYLREVLDISSTKTLGVIFDCWKDKGYLYFDTSSVNKRKDMLVKFEKGMSPKRAYVLTIANSKKEAEWYV